MAGVLFVRDLPVEFVEERLVLRLLNKVCISSIQAWVNGVVRSLLSLQAEIGVKPNKEPVEPTMKGIADMSSSHINRNKHTSSPSGLDSNLRVGSSLGGGKQDIQ